MYLNDSMEEKYLKIKEKSKVTWEYLYDGEFYSTLYRDRDGEHLASVYATIKEDNSVDIYFAASSREMFRKYSGLKGHHLFEDKINDALWNTKAEECIDESQIWYDEPGPKYEMYINDIKLCNYKELVTILDNIVLTLVKCYTRRKYNS